MNDFQKSMSFIVALFGFATSYAYFYPIEWVPNHWRPDFAVDRLTGIVLFGACFLMMLVLLLIDLKNPRGGD